MFEDPIKSCCIDPSDLMSMNVEANGSPSNTKKYKGSTYQVEFLLPSTLATSGLRSCITALMLARGTADVSIGRTRVIDTIQPDS